MAIKMSEKLQAVVKELGLKEENILYMNIQRPFLERILSEEKKVEFRDLSEYWLKKLNNYNKDLSAKSVKPIKYILFQNGMKAEGAPRALVELKGQFHKYEAFKDEPREFINPSLEAGKRSFTIGKAKVEYPHIFKEAEYEGFEENDEWLALELGKIVYREHI